MTGGEQGITLEWEVSYWLEVNSEASTYVAYFRHLYVRHMGADEVVSVTLKHLLKRAI
jgi:hypothetical protein